DAAGNASPPSGAFTLTIDTAQPATPPTPNLLAADDTGTVGDGVTSVKQPHLTGTAEAGSTVVLINASGTNLGPPTASPAGSLSVAPSVPLADGSSPLRVVAIDVAGNNSAPSGTFTLVVLTATPATPSAPALAAADDTGAKGDGVTSVKQPHLVG